MISFAVTAYQEMRPERQHGRNIIECIAAANVHPCIDEIVVVDDASDDFNGLQTALSGLVKVRLYRNAENLGVFGNKLEAVARATGDWVITCDSDNRMNREYLDKIVDVAKDRAHWYCPSFAKPRFDYRPWIGVHDRESIKNVLSDGGLANCLINTGNQTVHRDAFLRVFGKYRGCRADLLMPNWLALDDAQRRTLESRIVFDANDSLIYNMLWLNSGGAMNVVAGLEYDHYYTSGDESHYNRAPKAKHQLNDILLKELRYG